MNHSVEKIRRIAASAAAAGNACHRQGEVLMAEFWWGRADKLLSMAVGPVRDEELLSGGPVEPVLPSHERPMRVGERVDGPGGGVMTEMGFYTGD